MKPVVLVLSILIGTMAFGAEVGNDDAILKQIQLINQIPEDQLNDKADPGFSILRTLYDLDGPEFLTVRKLLGKASIRGPLNPGAKCLLAGILSQRWDSFSLAGNLYLAGLKSTNPDLRAKARTKLVAFIQPAHIPVLIDVLPTPGPNVLAYEILQEVTGQHFDPTVKAWRTWWTKSKGKPDLVGVLLKDTKIKLLNQPIHGFDQARLWYAPEGINNVHKPYGERPIKEQTILTHWNDWVHTDVKTYVEGWTMTKPVLDRITHQPDPRVGDYLESLVADPGYGDYASVLLAWRTNTKALEAIRAAYPTQPTVGRALARGALGDLSALEDMLTILESHKSQPLSFELMDDMTREYISTLRSLGVIPAEKAFELLSHKNFDFDGAVTTREKKAAFKSAKSWFAKNGKKLTLDRRRGYYLASEGR